MAANIITFESEYMKEYVKKVENAKRLVDEARTSLKKANRHDGWRCPERHSINNSLNDISTRIDRISKGLIDTSSALTKGAGQFSDLESRTQSEESKIYNQLKKNWAFEALKWIIGVIGGAIGVVKETIGGLLPVTPVPPSPNPGAIVTPSSGSIPYTGPGGQTGDTSGGSLPSGPKEVSPPNLNESSYSEYRNGFTSENGKQWRYQCVGYAKGRLQENLGVSLGAWGDGGKAASTLWDRYKDNPVISGKDGSYKIELCSADNVKAPSIASFNPILPSNPEGHVVYIEDVWQDENGVTMVKYSEANADGKGDGGGTDGQLQTVTLAEFKNYHNGVNNMLHFEKV